MNPKALVPAVALVLLLGPACSDGDDGTAQEERIAEDSASGESQESSSGETSRAGDQDSTDGEPIATARAELPASLIDPRLVPLRLDVMRFERTGDLIELDMLLTNEADPAGQDPPGFTPWGTFADVTTGTDLAGVGLLVSGEQRLYLPVFDSEGRCLCTGDLSATEVPAGGSLPLSATFGGVPDDADALDIRSPSFPIMAGVRVGG